MNESYMSNKYFVGKVTIKDDKISRMRRHYIDTVRNTNTNNYNSRLKYKINH
jgi:hypothetical protein